MPPATPSAPRTSRTKCGASPASRPSDLRQPRFQRARSVIYGDRTSGLLYLSPYLIGLAVFTLFPFVASLLLSFSDYRLQDSLGTAHLIGIENYRAIFHD